jgi:hypothetical protein
MTNYPSMFVFCSPIENYGEAQKAPGDEPDAKNSLQKHPKRQKRPKMTISCVFSITYAKPNQNWHLPNPHPTLKTCGKSPGNARARLSGTPCPSHSVAKTPVLFKLRGNCTLCIPLKHRLKGSKIGVVGPNFDQQCRCRLSLETLAGKRCCPLRTNFMNDHMVPFMRDGKQYVTDTNTGEVMEVADIDLPSINEMVEMGEERAKKLQLSKRKRSKEAKKQVASQK